MELEMSIRRYAHFWRGVTPESVGAYLKTLRQQRKQFDDAEFSLPQPFRLHDSARRDVIDAFDREIRLGEFYFELRGKRKEAGFDTWVFTPREDRKEPYGWRTPKGDAWTRSNGRIKAEIELDWTRTMTRVSLRLENDSDQLVLYSREGGAEVSHRHLRNEKSIQAEVERLKNHAEEVMRKHLLPEREARERELLRDVLLLQ